MNRKDDVLITVFTPTLNRGYIIENLYHSLVRQTYSNFEWIVIDQGKDDTYKLMESFKREGLLTTIKYFRREQRPGINRAYNDALNIAEGELFFKVDDDDFLTDDALETILFYYKSIDRSNMAGVSGLRAYHDGSPIGTNWKSNKDYIDATNFERKKLGLGGDKAEAYLTEVLRAYAPLPEIEGEKYTDEGILYYRIANAGYKIRWFHKVIYYTEYLEDGLSTNWRKNVKSNPVTFKNNTMEYMKYKQFTFWHKIRLFATYSSVYRELGFRKKQIYEGFSHPFIFLELGWIAGYAADIIKARNRR